MDRSKTILVTGATGYIGGRLVPRLLDAGFSVRCMVRAPRKLLHRPWADHERVEIVQGSAEEEADVLKAMEGCEVAYYLIHSMLVAGSSYSEQDRRLALVFARCAEACGLRRLIYLGGLGETGDGLSDHLASRREVEQCLASGTVPVTVFRAAMIIGSGSASFEILRYLVERLPVMVTPRWVSTLCQPIAIRNVLFYLEACLDVPETQGRTLDIGGPDILTYAELMSHMAQARGLGKRWVLPVPVLSPHLSSLWIHFITPLSHRIARPLAEGLRNEVVCRSDEAHRLMPQELLPVRSAIDKAIENLNDDRVETRWTDAGPMPGDPDWAGGSVFNESWSVPIAATSEEVFRAVCRIGGGHGWYAADWLWRVRGWMDRMVGGPGLRRGRRQKETLSYGDSLDFWRVTDVTAPETLALRAEMRLPGEEQLMFRIEPDEQEPTGSVRLVQTAGFIPRGLSGLLYWYAVKPLHGLVFRGMLDGIRRSAEEAAGVEPASRPPVVRV